MNGVLEVLAEDGEIVVRAALEAVRLRVLDSVGSPLFSGGLLSSG